ncbi:hypothetical protein B0A72_14855 [Flavobacterium pectinovorum]|uniref:Uncharacterized protein n=1 Tax=Flavobacterium pectinovorum TaxID=29533 RepID=A0AB36NYT6_9FLAO|nr:hypothetical protein B0A72_14855 [Flavobacterium pectinovorum]
MCKKKETTIIVVSFCDLDGTNFYKFYGRFEEIGLLLVGYDFHWLKEFGLDVLLGIDLNFFGKTISASLLL